MTPSSPSVFAGGSVSNNARRSPGLANRYLAAINQLKPIAPLSSPLQLDTSKELASSSSPSQSNLHLYSSSSIDRTSSHDGLVPAVAAAKSWNPFQSRENGGVWGGCVGGGAVVNRKRRSLRQQSKQASTNFYETDGSSSTSSRRGNSSHMDETNPQQPQNSKHYLQKHTDLDTQTTQHEQGSVRTGGKSPTKFYRRKDSFEPLHPQPLPNDKGNLHKVADLQNQWRSYRQSQYLRTVNAQKREAQVRPYSIEHSMDTMTEISCPATELITNCTKNKGDRNGTDGILMSSNVDATEGNDHAHISERKRTQPQHYSNNNNDNDRNCCPTAHKDEDHGDNLGNRLTPLISHRGSTVIHQSYNSYLETNHASPLQKHNAYTNVYDQKEVHPGVEMQYSNASSTDVETGAKHDGSYKEDDEDDTASFSVGVESVRLGASAPPLKYRSSSDTHDSSLDTNETSRESERLTYATSGHRKISPTDDFLKQSSPRELRVLTKTPSQAKMRQTVIGQQTNENTRVTKDQNSLVPAYLLRQNSLASTRAALENPIEDNIEFRSTDVGRLEKEKAIKDQHRHVSAYQSRQFLPAPPPIKRCGELVNSIEGSMAPPSWLKKASLRKDCHLYHGKSELESETNSKKTVLHQKQAVCSNNDQAHADMNTHVTANDTITPPHAKQKRQAADCGAMSQPRLSQPAKNTERSIDNSNGVSLNKGKDNFLLVRSRLRSKKLTNGDSIGEPKLSCSRVMSNFPVGYDYLRSSPSGGPAKSAFPSLETAKPFSDDIDGTFMSNEVNDPLFVEFDHTKLQLGKRSLPSPPQGGWKLAGNFADTFATISTPVDVECGNILLASGVGQSAIAENFDAVSNRKEEHSPLNSTMFTPVVSSPQPVESVAFLPTASMSKQVHVETLPERTAEASGFMKQGMLSSLKNKSEDENGYDGQKSKEAFRFPRERQKNNTPTRLKNAASLIWPLPKNVESEQPLRKDAREVQRQTFCPLSNEFLKSPPREIKVSDGVLRRGNKKSIPDAHMDMPALRIENTELTDNKIENALSLNVDNDGLNKKTSLHDVDNDGQQKRAFPLKSKSLADRITFFEQPNAAIKGTTREPRAVKEVLTTADSPISSKSVARYQNVGALKLKAMSLTASTAPWTLKEKKLYRMNEKGNEFASEVEIEEDTGTSTVLQRSGESLSSPPRFVKADASKSIAFRMDDSEIGDNDNSSLRRAGFRSKTSKFESQTFDILSLQALNRSQIASAVPASILSTTDIRTKSFEGGNNTTAAQENESISLLARVKNHSSLPSSPDHIIVVKEVPNSVDSGQFDGDEVADNAVVRSGPSEINSRRSPSPGKQSRLTQQAGGVDFHEDKNVEDANDNTVRLLGANNILSKSDAQMHKTIKRLSPPYLDSHSAVQKTSQCGFEQEHSRNTTDHYCTFQGFRVKSKQYITTNKEPASTRLHQLSGSKVSSNRTLKNDIEITCRGEKGKHFETNRSVENTNAAAPRLGFRNNQNSSTTSPFDPDLQIANPRQNIFLASTDTSQIETERTWSQASFENATSLDDCERLIPSNRDSLRANSSIDHCVSPANRRVFEIRKRNDAGLIPQSQFPDGNKFDKRKATRSSSLIGPSQSNGSQLIIDGVNKSCSAPLDAAGPEFQEHARSTPVHINVNRTPLQITPSGLSVDDVRHENEVDKPGSISRNSSPIAARSRNKEDPCHIDNAVKKNSEQTDKKNYVDNGNNYSYSALQGLGKLQTLRPSAASSPLPAITDLNQSIKISPQPRPGNSIRDRIKAFGFDAAPRQGGRSSPPFFQKPVGHIKPQKFQPNVDSNVDAQDPEGRFEVEDRTQSRNASPIFLCHFDQNKISATSDAQVAEAVVPEFQQAEIETPFPANDVKPAALANERYLQDNIDARCIAAGAVDMAPDNRKGLVSYQGFVNSLSKPSEGVSSSNKSDSLILSQTLDQFHPQPLHSETMQQVQSYNDEIAASDRSGTNVARSPHSTEPKSFSCQRSASTQNLAPEKQSSASDFDDDDCDGVTLSPSSTDVSALTNPSCLDSVSSESSDGKSLPTNCSSTDKNTGATENLGKQSAKGPSEASSSQTSEAAVPLIHFLTSQLNTRNSLFYNRDGLDVVQESCPLPSSDALPSMSDDSLHDEATQPFITVCDAHKNGDLGCSSGGDLRVTGGEDFNGTFTSSFSCLSRDKASSQSHAYRGKMDSVGQIFQNDASRKDVYNSGIFASDWNGDPSEDFLTASNFGIPKLGFLSSDSNVQFDDDRDCLHFPSNDSGKLPATANGRIDKSQISSPQSKSVLPNDIITKKPVTGNTKGRRSYRQRHIKPTSEESLIFDCASIKTGDRNDRVFSRTHPNGDDFTQALLTCGASSSPTAQQRLYNKGGRMTRVSMEKKINAARAVQLGKARIETKQSNGIKPSELGPVKRKNESIRSSEKSNGGNEYPAHKDGTAVNTLSSWKDNNSRISRRLEQLKESRRHCTLRQPSQSTGSDTLKKPFSPKVSNRIASVGRKARGASDAIVSLINSPSSPSRQIRNSFVSQSLEPLFTASKQNCPSPPAQPPPSLLPFRHSPLHSSTSSSQNIDNARQIDRATNENSESSSRPAPLLRGNIDKVRALKHARRKLHGK